MILLDELIYLQCDYTLHPGRGSFLMALAYGMYI